MDIDEKDSELAALAARLQASASPGALDPSFRKTLRDKLMSIVAEHDASKALEVAPDSAAEEADNVQQESLLLYELHTEKGAMSKFKDEILSYFISQTGILPGMMRRYPSLGTRLVAWLTGEKPVLIIGGEPGSGKSLFMGELVLLRNELIKLYPDLQSPLALISYDRVHYLFLKRLAQVDMINERDFLPEGETHPEARKLITRILQDIFLFATRYFLQKTLTILEAPLIDHRGEDIFANLSVDGFPRQQVFIIHSPAMQSRILQQEKQQTRGVSAPPLAIQQIHEALLQQRAIISGSQQAQNSELIKSWKQWLGNRDGELLSWDPSDDEAGFLHTKEALKANNIPPNPLSPQVLYNYAICLIEAVFETIPNLEAFADEVKNYQ